VSRWWVYQRERFPLLAHGALIFAFSFSAVSFSALVRGQQSMPPIEVVLVAFATSFLFFLQLRIADEFKDYEEDARYRPYRAVPRGLVTLRELGVVAVAAMVVQLGLAVWLNAVLVPFLLLVWGYMALMAREFFVSRWLKAHPVAYLASHMAIIPLIDFYVAACEWRGASVDPPTGLGWFVLASFFNGIVLEVGRKIRAPQDEEAGVETYSFLWGREVAVRAWLSALLLTALGAVLAASRVHALVPMLATMSGPVAAAFLVARRYLRHPVTPAAQWIERFSGVWTLLMYVGLGVLARLWVSAPQVDLLAMPGGGFSALR
jgi:4-hydroxybenzoate polyprenyltransferase